MRNSKETSSEDCSMNHSAVKYALKIAIDAMIQIHAVRP